MNPVWIFDLDDTLHNASAHIFPHINRAMTQYMMTHLHMNEAEANYLRGYYWQRYGATLNGLMRHHGTNPQHFLHHTHQFPHIGDVLVKWSGLRAALLRLRGDKVVFTNAPHDYAEQVLRGLNIRDLFSGVFSIESAHFQPKPAMGGFVRLLKKMKLQPKRCVMVEDNLPALKTAKRLGMTTVYINPRARRPSFVDMRLPSVLRLPSIQFNKA